MNQLFGIFFGLVMVIPFVWSNNVTPVVQCPGESFADLRERIEVIPCGKTRCKLQKNSNTTVIFKFTSGSTEIKSLVSEVYADIGGLKLPFLGVTDVSACPYVKKADTGESAPCPLAPGQEYIYTNVFPIHSFYPSLGMTVHWSLNDGSRKVICFEVPAIITGTSKKEN